MLNVLVFLQVVITLACLASILVVAYQKATSYSSVIITAFICTFVQNGAYILELLSKNVGEGMMAVKSEYLGGAFEICLITFFMFKYCGHEFKTAIQGLLLFEGCVVLFSVWSFDKVTLYYKSVEYVSEGVVPHLVMTHGWLYYVFAVTTVIELLACIFILAVSMLKTKQKHMKYNYIVLGFVVIVPLLGFILSISGLLEGYDATPMGAGIAVTIFAVAILRKHVFDVADAAGELILANMDNAIIVQNIEDGFEYANNKAKELFPALKEYDKHSIIQDVDVKNIFDSNRSNQVIIGGRQFDITLNQVKYNNEEIGKSAILFDTTESKKQLEQMKDLMSAAEAANNSKTTFLANISHEIRTPINIIMGTAEVLLRDYAKEETKEYYKNIQNSSNTLLNLINDILDYSKMETGDVTLKDSKFDVKKLFEELKSVYTFRCEQKKLEFKVDIAQDMPRFLIGDEFRVRQIANNLLTNAVKFTEEGYVQLKVGYKLRNDYDIDIIMAVEDTGIGIRQEDQEDLYDGFVKGDQKKNSAVDGAGLGLNITKQIVDLMGGIINFKSEYGKGTVFSVVMPLRVAIESNDTVEDGSYDFLEDDIFRSPFTAPDAEILLVDDSKINLMVTKELLKDTQAKVTVVDSGDECLKIIAEKHFDIIFMDHRMPKMDGVETFSRMKQASGKCEGVPVVMHTANASEDSREYYIARGFADFLTKPVTSKQLATVLYKLLPEKMIHFMK